MPWCEHFPGILFTTKAVCVQGTHRPKGTCVFCTRGFFSKTSTGNGREYTPEVNGSRGKDKPVRQTGPIHGHSGYWFPAWEVCRVLVGLEFPRGRTVATHFHTKQHVTHRMFNFYSCMSAHRIGVDSQDVIQYFVLISVFFLSAVKVSPHGCPVLT